MVNRPATTMPIPTQGSSASRSTDEPVPTAPRAARDGWLAPNWLWVLAALGVALLLLNVGTFYPGFMSTDSVDQLEQALDTRLLSDWHPPVMTALWWLLLKLSFQTVGVMLVAQVALLWGSLTL